MGFTYNFPRPKAVPGEGGVTQRGVADELCDLSANLYTLADSEDPDAYLMGLMRLSATCEGAIRQFDMSAVASARNTLLWIGGGPDGD